MKRFFSIILVAALLFSVLAVGVNAKGTCIFYDDFSGGFSHSTWMLDGGYDACAFIWDQNNRYLYGQDDAIVLQTNHVRGGKMWKDHYYSIDVRVQQGGLGESDGSNVILQFQDLFQSKVSNAPVYSFSIVVQTGEAYLVKEFSYKDENGHDAYSWVAMDTAHLPGYIEIDPDAEWFTLGMRITEGKIQCYFNKRLILESSYNPNDTKLGKYNQNTPDATVGTQKYPLVFINYNNILNVDNFQVWTGDYNFRTLAGDVNGDDKTNLSDVSRLLQYLAGWKDASVDIHQLDLNGDGAKNLSDAAALLKKLAGWN